MSGPNQSATLFERRREATFYHAIGEWRRVGCSFEQRREAKGGDLVPRHLASCRGWPRGRRTER